MQSEPDGNQEPHPKHSSMVVTAMHSSQKVLGRGYGTSSCDRVCPSGPCVSRALQLCSEVLGRIWPLHFVSAIK